MIPRGCAGNGIDQTSAKPIPRSFAATDWIIWATEPSSGKIARDYERDPATPEAMIRWAAINTMTSRIARGEPATRQQRWRWPDES